MNGFLIKLICLLFLFVLNLYNDASYAKNPDCAAVCYTSCCPDGGCDDGPEINCLKGCLLQCRCNVYQSENSTQYSLCHPSYWPNDCNNALVDRIDMGDGRYCCCTIIETTGSQAGSTNNGVGDQNKPSVP